MSWYAVHTRSRHEDKVHVGLIQKGYQAFLPKMETWSKRTDRKKKILLPMFPGYLFVDLAPISGEVRLDVLKTFGVVKILGDRTTYEPIAVPDATISALQKIVTSKVEIQHFQYPKVGEPARITDGPFRGVEGIVVGTDYEKELFFITIELLRRSVAIKLEGSQIEKI